MVEQATVENNDFSTMKPNNKATTVKTIENIDLSIMKPNDDATTVLDGGDTTNVSMLLFQRLFILYKVTYKLTIF